MKMTFKKFLTNLSLTNTTYSSTESLQNHFNDGDFFFVGSDQVWNPNIMRDDLAYFLSFAPENSKKIGYAVSMGNQPLSREFLAQALLMLQKFTSISGRETYVSDFVKRYFPSLDVPVVLDPTLLLNKDDYQSLYNTRKYKSEFIAVYSAMQDSRLYEYAKILQKKTGLELINLGHHFNGADKQEYIWGPENWLNRIEQSKYFITNSFHGTAFSILYKKNFIVVPNQNSDALNTRFIELLKRLHLDDRTVNSVDDIDRFILDKPSDFSNAVHLLDEERKKSFKYLEAAIKHD